ncbi:Peptidase-S8 domain-containing protein [Fusarium sp. LHS14.1]|nr:Peptidase-S8 domain-containing protein [Fusarium sp. LHS14.1]
MADDNAARMLASWGKRFSPILLRICLDTNRKLPIDIRCQAGHIASYLKSASATIDKLPQYWIEPDLNKICRGILTQLTEICIWPDKIQKSQVSADLIMHSCLSLLVQSDGPQMKKSITQFFSLPQNTEKIDDFVKVCKRLYKYLNPTGTGDSRHPPPYRHDMAQYDQCKHNGMLFNVLLDHCRCCPSRHTSRLIANNGLLWHPTRLFLEGSCHDPSFSILVSSLDMSYWQELRLHILSSNSAVAANLEMLGHGHICSLVDESLFVPVYVELWPDCGLYQRPRPQKKVLIRASGHGESLASALQNYEFNLQDRILLSYSIARAYWQFYDSELMRRKWSSESIWFMPATNSKDKDVLPLQAFVSFPFGAPDDPAEDFIHDPKIPINHRCPRIFVLGILLLEIGLGRPIQTVAFQNPSSQANLNHAAAMGFLEVLQKTKWNGFSHMASFLDAVEYCLDCQNFFQESYSATDSKKNMSTRRKNLFDRVVRPLEWLAINGFRYNSAELRYLRRAAKTAHDHSPAHEAHVGPEGDAFHSGSTSRMDWMEKLKGISSQIDKMWADHEPSRPIRVAILDTGINDKMPYYQDEEPGEDSAGQLDAFQDFVNPESTDRRDKFGHGSLMARLVAEAIRWAGQEKADIISMSFGFPETDEEISKAIDEVSSRKGGAIFLASSGNSSDEAEAFPARHRDVISIYATNRHGTFQDSNSQPPTESGYILGTFGHDIPPRITAEFESEYRGVCQPGSSIATAVAAGIAALMLAFIASRPETFSSRSDDRVFQRAYCSQGMRALFRSMGPNARDGRLFINPMYFWRKHDDHESMFHTIHSCLSSIHRFP